MQHPRHVQTWLGSAMLTILTVASVGAAAADEAPPNIVIMFVDDMGYGDAAVYGSSMNPMPNLARMAAEGLRCTDFYVAQPVCSASRAALLTGCYPNRIGISGALGPNSTVGIADDELTLAELCQSRGYATAIFGKWHLGHRPRFLPTRHGFDEFEGIPYSNDMWPLHPHYVDMPREEALKKGAYPELPYFTNEAITNPNVTAADQAIMTRRFTERAVDFIDRHHDRPFFVYIPHPMPHVPLYTSDTFTGSTGRGVYADVMAEIDWSAGEILDALARHGIDERTLFIFASDNGPWLSYGNHSGVTGPLREGKGTTFEGGVRVPCIMRWPQRIAPGIETSTPMMTIDILPTIAALIDAELPDHTIDGKDVGAVLFEDPRSPSPHDAYYFYYHRNDLEAMRAGRWKLHFPHGFRSMDGRTPGDDGKPGPYDYGRRTELELYDLQADVGETKNVAADHPAVVARLVQLADTMRADLGDNLTEATPTGARAPGRVEAP